MIRTLARVPFARLARTRRGWFPVGAWFAFAIVAALLSRTTGRTGSATHLLLGPFSYAILPLSAYGIVSATLGGVGLRAAGRGLVALGARPDRAALASVLVAMISSALVGGVIAALLCIIAHGPGDPSLVSDLPATFGIAFVGAATYASYFCAGSAIGRGSMRAVFLLLDWVLGVPAGFGAIFVPRGHVTSLLGGPACFELSRPASSMLLLLLLGAYLATAVRLGRRPR